MPEKDSSHEGETRRGTWLGGAAAVFVGMAAVFLIAVPVFLVLGSLLSGIGGVAARDPANLGPWFVLVPSAVVLLWFVVRFFLPAFLGIAALQGPFGSRLATLKRSAGLVIVRDRLRVLRADLAALLRVKRG